KRGGEADLVETAQDIDARGLHAVMAGGAAKESEHGIDVAEVDLAEVAFDDRECAADESPDESGGHVLKLRAVDDHGSFGLCEFGLRQQLSGMAAALGFP